MSATTKQTAKIHYDEIDPNDLVIGDNVRDNADQGPEFEQLVSSIKETGHIYQPINVVIGADGAYVVTDGQRRTLAARRLGLATVPVRVQQPIAATDKQRTAERVTEQLATDNAKGLTVAQKAKGVQELLLADVTPAKVAKVTGYGKEFVNAATKVVKSTKALAALDEAQLTMEQALALIEFEDDDQAIEYLKDAATEGEFDHRASELRIRKAAEADYTERTKPYADKGFTILPFDFRQWQSDLDIVHAERLYASLDDSDDRDVSIETIESNPQLWAVHLSEQECYIDTRTDAVVDEDLIEWSLEDKPDEEAPEGRIHPKHIGDAERFLPEYYCKDTAAAGVFTWEERLEAYRAQHQTSAPSPGHDADERRNAAEEAARAERRKVLQLNRLGEAAQTVRRTWVRERLLSRKTPPKGAAIFLAQELVAHPDTITDYRAADMAAELLGTTEKGRTGLTALTADLAENADPRAIVVILGQLLGAMEAQTAKDSWRGGYYERSCKRYLQFLVDNGYEPAPVEQVILGHLTSDALFAQVDNKKADPAADIAAQDEGQDDDGVEPGDPEASENAAEVA
ncbi:putative transcriptional regulator [Mycobacteroides abscessus subsp. massiliense]|uniref:ParB/RepB/Spo0J family partition protein n=1 Tax=Mycobacteroides abscessus TaxID=36809 RepID=UPI00092A8133|nr:ParB/RepB/Spo0J family partition protein [Mycobacteroides abscessus]MBN7428746.1 ParB/RepB/Spo0J family partition protein [Mycobacteroides abscessus subsp. massiliense]SIN48498.1 putative transcriptional regulator [Mycobacteroides abscessus subsp. bolletii]SKL16478.1 putative transcriptional regulator [Mycobacteroides abscessus subsp. massiliense]SKL96020.1 putative transcriptional regulator [Mycobacteroides abscessus subsp. massiliense]SKM77049.1 putative transcriptional regulator [Mycobac